MEALRSLQDALRGRRGISMICGFVMLTIAGSQYMFPLYAEYLKQKLHYEESQLNFISAFGNLGQYTGILGGLFYDRFGPRLTSILAASLLFSGYCAIYASLKQMIPSSFLSLAFFAFCVGQGSHTTYISSLSTNSKLYDARYRGTVIGILLFAYGISALQFTAIYSNFFDPDVPSFLLCAALLCGGIDLVGSFLLLPSGGGAHDHGGSGGASPIDITGMRLLRLPHFWMLWVCLFVGTGTGLMFINNLSSMILAFGGKESDRHSLVILFSLCNATSRYLIGFVADKFATRIPRAFWLAAALVLMLCCHLTLFISPALRTVLYTGPVLAFGFGGVFSMIPSLVSLLYGMPHFGQNWGWMVFASGTGGLTFNMMASFIYQAHAPIGSRYCTGAECYRSAFAVTTLACTVAIGVSLLLTHQTWLSLSVAAPAAASEQEAPLKELSVDPMGEERTADDDSVTPLATKSE